MLTLPIKKKWFDMILSGEKKEEYREIKPYYTNRFNSLFRMYPIDNPIGNDTNLIAFKNGYSKLSPLFVAKCSLTRGTGNPEWGAEPGKEYYVLKILEVYQ